LPKQRSDPLDEIEFELLLGQTDDRAACQHRFEILLGILGVTRSAAVSVASRNEDSALDLDQRPALQVPEIRPPFPGGVDPDLGWTRADFHDCAAAFAFPGYRTRLPCQLVWKFVWNRCI
jgi:hypothetical protein